MSQMNHKFFSETTFSVQLPYIAGHSLYKGFNSTKESHLRRELQTVENPQMVTRKGRGAPEIIQYYSTLVIIVKCRKIKINFKKF